MGKMTEYRYSGPLSGASIIVDGALQDVLLNPRRTVFLPPAHEFTQTLIAQGRLVEVSAQQPTTSTKKVKEAPNGS